MDKQEVAGKLRRNWKVVFGVGVIGMVATVVLLIAGAAGLAWTNTEEF